MKETEYLKLWQQKRAEWPIANDADEDWGGMASLLDEYMPVKGGEGGSAAGRGSRLLPIIFISLSAAAMVFVTSKIVKHEWAAAKQKHSHHHKGHGGGAIMSDSSIAIAQQTQGIDTTTFMGDSTTADHGVDNKSVAGTKNAKANANTNGNSATATSTAANSSANKTKVANEANNSTSALATVPAGKGGSKLAAGRNHLEKNSGYSQQRNINVVTNPLDGTVASGAQFTSTQNQTDQTRALLDEPRQSLSFDMPWTNTFPTLYPTAPGKVPLLMAGNSKSKDKVTVPKSPRAPSNSPLEWGLLLGVNAPGSFTPKGQNSNFYGDLPIDPFAGAYATYHINDTWGIGTQLRVLSPSVINGTYTKSTYTQRIDTVNVLITHKTSDSRKLYSVQVPLFATYQATNVISFKAGPVFSFPTKQFSIAKIDSASRPLLSSSHYDQKTDLGLTGGISFRYKRLSFDATYLRGLTTHAVTGDSLSYKVHNSQVQFTIGIQIGGKKR